MATLPRLVLSFLAYPSPIRGTAGVFVVATTCREEGQVAKQAGMWFHGRRGECRMNPCLGCAASVPYLGGYDRPAYWYLPADAKGRANCARLAEIADDSAKAVLAGTADAVEASRATDLTAAQADVVIVEGPRADRHSFGYQRAGVASILARRNAGCRGIIVGDEMGLGKTAQALLTINSDPRVRTTLIVCPASLRLNWALECAMWLARPAAIHIVDSAVKVPPSVLARAGAHTITSGPVPPADATIVIANFDRTRAKRIKDAEGNVIATLTNALQDSLMARSWDLLVIDEAHRLKNAKALQTVACFGTKAKRGVAAVPGLAQRSSFLLLLTGSPIPNKIVELWPLLDAVAPEAFPSFFGFAKRYCDAHQEEVARDKTVWIMDGASNLEELQGVLRSTCLIRRLKADVLHDLPSKTRQLVVLPLNGAAAAVGRETAAWEEYEEDVEELRAQADLAHAAGDMVAYEIAVARLRKAQTVAFEGLSKHRHAVAVAKVPAVIAHIEALLEDGVQKLVVMAHHRDVVAAIVAGMPAGTNPVSLTGDTSMADRQAVVDRFQTDPTCRVFVGNIQAAGVGITLTAASTMVFAELDWVPANVSQAEDREHRIGQTANVLIQHLVFDGSLDQRMAEILIAKQAIADAALDTRRAAIVIPEVQAREPRPERPAPVATVDVNAPVEAREGTRIGARRPAAYPVATDLQRDAAATAMRTLASMDQDHAMEDNGIGFSKSHTRIGHALAHLARPMTDGEVWLAAQLATIFRGQLSVELVAAVGGKAEVT